MEELPFEEISLSKVELSALKELEKALNRHKAILVEAGNKTVLERLDHFKFAEIQPYINGLNGKTAYFPLPKQATITDRGRDYLAYLGGKKKERKNNRRHDIILLLISAIIAMFFDHLDDFLGAAQYLFDFLTKQQ